MEWLIRKNASVGPQGLEFQLTGLSLCSFNRLSGCHVSAVYPEAMAMAREAMGGACLCASYVMPVAHFSAPDIERM